MFGSGNYYGLVAGLREYAPETGGKGFDARAIVESIRPELSKADRRVLELFYGWYDILNASNIRAGRPRFEEPGNFTREELAAGLEEPESLPAWMSKAIEAYRNPEDAADGAQPSGSFERTLFDAYYAECARSRNRFLREWSDFDRSLRNIIAAYTARDREMPAADRLVGSDDTVKSLERSSAADFGLRGEVDYIDRLLDALDGEADIVEKERAIDAIRWKKAGELAEFDYFDMNAILCYLARVNIIHRWTALDPAAGREMYGRLVSAMDAGGRIRGRKKEPAQNESDEIRAAYGQ